MGKEIHVQTGGKLYIAGEYAVLTPGQTAILKNIPIFMTATVKPADIILLQSDMFDYRTDMTPDTNYALIQETICVLADYLNQTVSSLTPFSLSITGKMEENGKKFGIGSSGSVTVLTLKALSMFYDLHLSSDIIFMLASYTLIKRGDNGSMGDIACIAYDDLIAFTSFDRSRVSYWIETETLHDVLEMDWRYSIDIIKSSLHCDFLVGWTKQPSISKDMINLVKRGITTEFLEKTQTQVIHLKNALLKGDKTLLKLAVANISDYLKNLHPKIYNDKLLRLRHAAQGLDAVAKSSGSGGGDCGIALSFDSVSTQKIIHRWKESGIDLLVLEEL